MKIIATRISIAYVDDDDDVGDEMSEWERDQL